MALIINGKGVSSLFLKWCKVAHKSIFASTFCNGTRKVVTSIISTMHIQCHPVTLGKTFH